MLEFIGREKQGKTSLYIFPNIDLSQCNLTYKYKFIYRDNLLKALPYVSIQVEGKEYLLEKPSTIQMLINYQEQEQEDIENIVNWYYEVFTSLRDKGKTSTGPEVLLDYLPLKVKDKFRAYLSQISNKSSKEETQSISLLRKPRRKIQSI
jgi:hypothetical protein